MIKALRLALLVAFGLLMGVPAQALVFSGSGTGAPPSGYTLVGGDAVSCTLAGGDATTCISN